MESIGIACMLIWKIGPISFCHGDIENQGGLIGLYLCLVLIVIDEQRDKENKYLVFL